MQGKRVSRTGSEHPRCRNGKKVAEGRTRAQPAVHPRTPEQRDRPGCQRGQMRDTTGGQTCVAAGGWTSVATGVTAGAEAAAVTRGRSYAAPRSSADGRRPPRHPAAKAGRQTAAGARAPLATSAPAATTTTRADTRNARRTPVGRRSRPYLDARGRQPPASGRGATAKQTRRLAQLRPPGAKPRRRRRRLPDGGRAAGCQPPRVTANPARHHHCGRAVGVPVTQRRPPAAASATARRAPRAAAAPLGWWGRGRRVSAAACRWPAGECSRVGGRGADQRPRAGRVCRATATATAWPAAGGGRWWGARATGGTAGGGGRAERALVRCRGRPATLRPPPRRPPAAVLAAADSSAQRRHSRGPNGPARAGVAATGAWTTVAAASNGGSFRATGARRRCLRGRMAAATGGGGESQTRERPTSKQLVAKVGGRRAATGVGGARVGGAARLWGGGRRWRPAGQRGGPPGQRAATGCVRQPKTGGVPPRAATWARGGIVPPPPPKKKTEKGDHEGGHSVLAAAGCRWPRPASRAGPPRGTGGWRLASPAPSSSHWYGTPSLWGPRMGCRLERGPPHADTSSATAASRDTTTPSWRRGGGHSPSAQLFHQRVASLLSTRNSPGRCRGGWLGRAS